MKTVREPSVTFLSNHACGYPNCSVYHCHLMYHLSKNHEFALNLSRYSWHVLGYRLGRILKLSNSLNEDDDILFLLCAKEKKEKVMFLLILIFNSECSFLCNGQFAFRTLDQCLFFKIFQSGIGRIPKFFFQRLEQVCLAFFHIELQLWLRGFELKKFHCS